MGSSAVRLHPSRVIIWSPEVSLFGVARVVVLGVGVVAKRCVVAVTLVNPDGILLKDGFISSFGRVLLGWDAFGWKVEVAGHGFVQRSRHWSLSLPNSLQPRVRTRFIRLIILLPFSITLLRCLLQ